jgi:hypothetical protein
VITVDGATPEQRELAEKAAALVQQRVGRIGQPRLVFTDSRGMADLHVRAELALMPQMAADVRRNRVKGLGREARKAGGVTLITPTAGSSLILVNLDRSPAKYLPLFLVHELTHAVQLADVRARAAHLRYLRHACGIEEMPRPDFKQYMRHMDQQEREAARAERLARHLK